MCDSAYTGKWKLFPWNGLLYVFFHISVGTWKQSWHIRFLFPVRSLFLKSNPLCFSSLLILSCKQFLKTHYKAFYKPGFLDWIEQNILVLARGLNWLFPMNPQHYCFWLNWNSTPRPPRWKVEFTLCKNILCVASCCQNTTVLIQWTKYRNRCDNRGNIVMYSLQTWPIWLLYLQLYQTVISI